MRRLIFLALLLFPLLSFSATTSSHTPKVTEQQSEQKAADKQSEDFMQSYLDSYKDIAATIDEQWITLREDLYDAIVWVTVAAVSIEENLSMEAHQYLQHQQTKDFEQLPDSKANHQAITDIKQSKRVDPIKRDKS